MRGATAVLWRARLRSSVRRVVALTVLMALGAGVSLACAAGARRTSDAFDEVLDRTNSGELGASFNGLTVEQANELLGSVPGVGGFSQRVGFQISLPEVPIPGISAFAYNNEPVVVERLLMLEGRMPRSADEVFVSESAARVGRIRVGDRLDAQIGAGDSPETVPVTLTVVGRGAVEVYVDETGNLPTLIFGKAFADAHKDLAAWGSAVVDLAPGASRDDVLAQLQQRGLAIDDDRRLDRQRAADAVRPLAVTLALLALLAGIGTAAVIGQAVHRLVQRVPAEQRALVAMGCPRRTMVAADAGVALVIAAAGAAGGIAVAVAGSTFFPLGQARRLTPLRGVEFDGAVLGTGAIALMAAVVAVVAITSAWRRRTPVMRPGVSPPLLDSSVTLGTAARLATAGRGLAAPVATAIVGLGLVAAAVAFTGSMNRLVERPDLVGFSWDLLARDSYAGIDTAAVTTRARQIGGVERVTGLTFLDTVIGGRPVPASLWNALDGAPWPPIVSGRAPAAPREILVSPRTLDDLGRSVGDTLEVGFDTSFSTGPPEVQTMKVVGTAVSPAVGLAGTDTPRLDEGILVRREDVAGRAFEYGGAVLFDLAPGTSAAKVRSAFPDGLPDDVGVATEWFETAQPAEVIHTREAIDVLLIAIVVLLIAITGTVAHNLLGFVRQRRSVFAVLRAIGFTPRQIRTTVLSQSGLVLALAIVIAIPLGVVAGRWAYERYARSIGAIASPAVPVVSLAAAIVATVVLVQLVALLPARRATLTRTGTELRHE